MMEQIDSYDKIIKLTFEPAQSIPYLKQVVSKLIVIIEEKAYDDLIYTFELILICRKYIDSSLEIIFGKNENYSHEKQQMDILFQTKTIKKITKLYYKSLEECVCNDGFSSNEMDSSYDGFLGRPIKSKDQYNQKNANSNPLKPIDENENKISPPLVASKDPTKRKFYQKHKSLTKRDESSSSVLQKSDVLLYKHRHVNYSLFYEGFKSSTESPSHMFSSITSNITSIMNESIPVHSCIEKLILANLTYEIDDVALYFFILIGPHQNFIEYTNAINKIDEKLFISWHSTVKKYEKYLYILSIRSWKLTKSLLKLAKTDQYFVFEKSFHFHSKKNWKEIFLTISNPENISRQFEKIQVQVLGFQENEVIFKIIIDKTAVHCSMTLWSRWQANRSLLFVFKNTEIIRLIFGRVELEIDEVECQIEMLNTQPGQELAFKVCVIISKFNMKAFKLIFQNEILEFYRLFDKKLEIPGEFKARGLEGFLERIFPLLTKVPKIQDILLHF